MADMACTDVGLLDNVASNNQTATDSGCVDIPNFSLILSYGASFMNLAFIYLFTLIYTQVAKYLTDAECHRTETAYCDSLVLKGFFFEFINRYFLLFYIAFFKTGEFMGTPDQCEVVNEPVAFVELDGVAVESKAAVGQTPFPLPSPCAPFDLDSEWGWNLTVGWVACL